jgi:hypothetical protein
MKPEKKFYIAVGLTLVLLSTFFQVMLYLKVLALMLELCQVLGNLSRICLAGVTVWYGLKVTDKIEAWVLGIFSIAPLVCWFIFIYYLIKKPKPGLSVSDKTL